MSGVVQTWNAGKCTGEGTNNYYGTSTVSNDWSTTTPHDETDSTSDAEFATTGISGSICASTDVFTYVIHMANPTAPGDSSACQELRINIRHRKNGVDASVGCGDIRVRLLQGVTVKHTSSNYTLSTAWTTTTIILSDAEYDSITDHDDLRLEVRARIGINSELEFENEGNVSYNRLQYVAK